MAIININNLAKLMKNYRHQKIVYCSGSFNLLNVGHIIHFEFCKKQGDILVVNIGPDKDIRRNKGNDRPILPQKIRLQIINSLKPIDYCFIGKEYRDGEDPFTNLESILKKLQPDIYVINNDSQKQIPLLKKFSKKYKFKLIVSNRKHPLSTTDIIEKIKALKT